MTNTPNENVRRHPAGSIDVDFYRTRAAALRGQAKRDAATARAAVKFVLGMAGALVLAVLVAGAPAHLPGRHAGMTQIHAPLAR